MSADLTVDQAVERAMRVQDQRIHAIRDLAEKRQQLAAARDDAARRLAEVERINAEATATAEKADQTSFRAAQRAGWSVDELRSIGFDEPGRGRRPRRRRPGSARTGSNGSTGETAPPSGDV